MMDLHNHILPGLDDGPRDMEESLRMSAILVSEGFRGVVSTPHFGRGGYFSDSDSIRKLVRELNKELKARKIELIVYPGMEILLSPEMPELIRSNRVLSLNDGKYVLMELPSLGIPAGLNNLVTQLVRQNKKLVIAHPEKNHDLQQRPDKLLELVNSFDPGDILIQITAGSLTDKAETAEFRTAKFMLQAGLVHIIATDAHSSVLRPPAIKTALTIASAIVGKERAMKMVNDWPQSIVRGECVTPERPLIKPKTQSVFNNFRNSNL